MPPSHPSDQLLDRYLGKPNAIAKLISVAKNLPVRWDPEQESPYRERMIDLLMTVQTVAQDDAIQDRTAVFNERFTAANYLEIKRFVVYVIFISLPDANWKQPVAWDSEGGRPVVYHLDSMLEQAEEIVLSLLARHLCGRA